MMAAQTRRVLVPRLDDHFEEPVIDVAILEGFQKLGSTVHMNIIKHPKNSLAFVLRMLLYALPSLHCWIQRETSGSQY